MTSLSKCLVLVLSVVLGGFPGADAAHFEGDLKSPNSWNYLAKCVAPPAAAPGTIPFARK